MAPWICQRLDVARVCSKPHSACLLHQTGLNRSNFGKSVSFVQAFIISKMKKMFAFFKLILDHQRRDHSVLVVLSPLPIHFLSWQLIITAQHKDGNKLFQLFMVIMNERLLLYQAYLFNSKNILSISSVVTNFSNISCTKIFFSKEGCVKVQLSRTLCTTAHPFYPSSISVLKQEVSSSFSKKHIIKLNTNMKYKIMQFKNIWRYVPSSHNASIAARSHKTVDENTVYHSIARSISSLLKYVYMLHFCCWRNIILF